jgi:predicted alpha-1,2-mannosidase
MTLEYAYNDWCIARMAEALGKPDQQAIFDQRAGNWRNQFDADSGFMRGRHRDGSWVDPFDPLSDTDFNDFCEASAWIYTWFVPHDPQALIEVLGGPAAFVEKLDQFFANGSFDPGNEPSFHVPYLYNAAGSAHRTQSTVRQLLTGGRFSAQPDGLPGNDDAGATSAWYVFNALGLFPLAPGDGRYQITSPLFERSALKLHPGFSAGGEFVIEVEREEPGEVYIQAAELNGSPLERSWITHAEIVAGGSLRLRLGPAPSQWGS